MTGPGVRLKVAAVLVVALVAGTVAVLWAVIGWDLQWLAIVVLALWMAGLQRDRLDVHERVDEASDVADRAHGGLEAVKNHLFGLEPEGSGKHAKGGRS